MRLVLTSPFPDSPFHLTKTAPSGAYVVKNQLYAANARHWQAAYGMPGILTLSKAIGAGDSIRPFKHNKDQEDKYLGWRLGVAAKEGLEANRLGVSRPARGLLCRCAADLAQQENMDLPLGEAAQQCETRLV
jgi:hypothetical protein